MNDLRKTLQEQTVRKYVGLMKWLNVRHATLKVTRDQDKGKLKMVYNEQHGN